MSVGSGHAAARGCADALLTTPATAKPVRLTVITRIETVVVNLMNTDTPGPRIGSVEWDQLLARVMEARLR